MSRKQSHHTRIQQIDVLSHAKRGLSSLPIYHKFLRKLVQNYLAGSLIAVLGVGGILIFSTLRISLYDAKWIALTLFVSLPFMFGAEFFVFRKHMRPIRNIYNSKETNTKEQFELAFMQLHKLPALAVRRIAGPHWMGMAIPSVILTLLEIRYFHLTLPVSYVLLAFIGSMLVASMHAIIEFFLTAEAITPMLSDLQTRAQHQFGLSLSLEGKVLISVKTKYRSSAVLIGVFPLFLFSLATQVRLVNSTSNGSHAYWQWAVVILAVGVAFSVYSASLLSRVVQNPIDELQQKMSEVQLGNLKIRAMEAYSDEFSRLVKGFNQMVEDLEAREIQNTLLTQSLLTTLAAALDARDPYTAGHSLRVAEYSVEIGKRIGLSETALKDLRESGLLHDIGKIGIPDRILLKDGKLTDEEYEIMKSHPVLGETILAQVQPPNAMAKLLPGVRSHHERFDGKGYPDGLAGHDIPQFGRIMAIADAFDAMTSNRPYRKGMPIQKALQILQQGSGTQWDPEYVSVFLEWAVAQEIEKVRETVASSVQ